MKIVDRRSWSFLCRRQLHSSIKKNQKMAPSPELGQPKPKAPDKVDTKECSADGTTNEMDIQKSSNATQQDTEVIIIEFSVLFFFVIELFSTI